MTLAQYGYGLACVGFGMLGAWVLPKHSGWLGATTVTVALIIIGYAGAPQS